MSRISERKKNSANVPEDERAEIVNGNQKKDKKSSIVKCVIIAVLIIASIAAALVFAINMIINNIYDSAVKGGDFDNDEVILNKSLIAQSTSHMESAKSDATYRDFYEKALLNYANASHNIAEQEDVYTYAIYGVDKYDAATGDADIILLVSLNNKTGKLVYVLLEKNALVYIPEADVVSPLCHAYKFGGSTLLSRAIKYNYGIDLDGYIEMSMKGFADMVNAVGNVSISGLSDADINKLNDSSVEFDKIFGTTTAKIQKGADGSVALDGNQALSYIRGSQSRTNALMTIIKESTKKAVKGGFDTIGAFADTLSSNTTIGATRDDFGSIVKMGINAISSVVDKNLETYTIGSDSADRHEISGVANSVYYSYADYSAMRKSLTDILYTAETAE